jgi:23S rRNA (pseudouridine1915-N3)-methyltransferase
LTIDILLLGKSHPNEIKDLSAFYLKKILPFSPVNIVELNPKKTFKEDLLNKNYHCDLILEKIKPKDFLVLLDENGQISDSKAFSNLLDLRRQHIDKNILFVICGAFGANDALRKRANYILSFGKMTLSHQLIRPVLFEQIYRGFSLIYNLKYHNE